MFRFFCCLGFLGFLVFRALRFVVFRVQAFEGWLSGVQRLGSFRCL